MTSLNAIFFLFIYYSFYDCNTIVVSVLFGLFIKIISFYLTFYFNTFLPSVFYIMFCYYYFN